MQDEKENLDVKQEDSAPSAEQTDVKQDSFDEAAAAAIESLTQDSSSDEVVEKATDESGSNIDPDKGKEGEEGSEEKEATSEEGEKKEDEEGHEKAVPYERFAEVNERLKEAEGHANIYRSWESYLKQNQISPEQFRRVLEVQSLINTNPAEAIKEVRKVLAELESVAGDNLPDDLRKDVEEGHISETRAKEMWELRKKAKKLEMQGQQTTHQVQQSFQQQVTSTFTNWVDAKRKTDPDFAPKKGSNQPDGKFEDFLAKFTYEAQRSKIESLQDLLQVADKAYEHVNTLSRRYAPPAKKKTVLTSNGASTKPKTAPKTMDDVAEQFAQKHGIH